MQMEDLLVREKARGESFRLLSECYNLPSEALNETLTNMVLEFGPICSTAALYAERMKKAIEKLDDLQSLRVDYARLFVGPYELLAPPYGSVYLDGERRVMGDSTVKVGKVYRRAGVDISNDFHETPDHIAAELEFMYFLIFKEVRSLGESDVGRAIDFLNQQKAFLKDHLWSWVPGFTEKVEEVAGTEFYKNLARATRAFLEENLDLLSNLVVAENEHCAEAGRSGL
jgi:TorA maturation chaperone TorD